MSAQILINVSPDAEDDKDTEEFRNINYYGSQNIDRRYIPTVLHWVAKEIIRKCAALKCTNAEITSKMLILKNPLHDAVSFLQFPFASIYRLSRLKNCGLDDYMAFVILNKDESTLCSLHVVKFDNHDLKNVFLKALKTKVLDFQKNVNILQDGVEKTSLNMTPPRPTHRRGVSSGAIILSPNSKDGVFRDSVYYIGKVTISQPQAPPKFIDDVLVQLKKMHNSENYRTKRSDSRNRFTMDASEEQKNGDLSILTRNRSSSCNSDIRSKQKEKELSYVEKEFKSETVTNDVIYNDSVTLNNIQEEVQTRLVTLSISKTSLMLFSVGSKTMLLEKKIKNISFCTKGESRSDHFGFICKESGNHICYIFQGESETKVDGIMKAMKVAFGNALQASAHLAICDNCPIQNLHKLCTKLEGVPLIEQSNLLQDFLDTLSDYDQLHVANAVNEEGPENEEQKVDITVEVLRKLCDEQQKYHTHAHKLQNHLLPENAERDRSRSTTIFEKAKKSLTSSFQAMKKPINGKPSNPNVLRLKSDDPAIKPRSRSYEAPSSCPTTPDFASRKLEFSFSSGKNSRSNSIEETERNVSEKESVESKKSVIKNVAEVKKEKLGRRESWRQAIYHSVVTPSRKSSTSSIATLPREFEEHVKGGKVDPRERARERWKNAIMNQILLIRMEKENKKLAANISATELRRQKLCYEEMCTYSAESASAWDELLTRHNEKVDDHVLLGAVKGGVPRMRRGEIWQFLIKQYTIRIPDKPEEQYWKQTSYRKLLTQNTTHQHAILIDLGRTFPTHAHFIPRLGSGQLSLFNILKAYSLLDREVGYCQGLSFVAGVLLMHMSEEDTFKSFCHLMFDLQIRNQYKPDMNAVQQQLYQLSRLLHDYHPTLYKHLNVHEVTPTLYAAPWFLTLYASQYPIGFVSRVMDLLLLQGLEVIFKVALVLVGNHADEILECDSFESIVEYMKSNLPEKVVNETDDICSRALNMDISQQLNLYEVEYQMLHEEMIDIRQNKERIEKQEVAHKELVHEVTQLHGELKIAKNLIKTLKTSLDESICQKKDLETKMFRVAYERDLLRTALGSLQDETDGVRNYSEEVNRILTTKETSCLEKNSNSSLSTDVNCQEIGNMLNGMGNVDMTELTNPNMKQVTIPSGDVLISSDVLSLSSVSTSSENSLLKMDITEG